MTKMLKLCMWSILAVGMLSLGGRNLHAQVGSGSAEENQPEKKVLQTLDRLGEAYVKKDVPALSALLDKNVIWGHATGGAQDKEGVLKSAGGPNTTEVFRFSDAIVHIYGNTAVVRSLLELRHNSATEPMHTHHFEALYVLMKSSGGWVVVGAQRIEPKDKTK